MSKEVSTTKKCTAIAKRPSCETDSNQNQTPDTMGNSSESNLSRMTDFEFKEHAFKLIKHSFYEPQSFLRKHGLMIHDILTEATNRLAARPAKPYHIDPVAYDFNVIRTIYAVYDGPIRRYGKLINEEPLKHQAIRLINELNHCKSGLSAFSLVVKGSDHEMKHVDAVGHLNDQIKVIQSNIASRVQMLLKMAATGPKQKKKVKKGKLIRRTSDSIFVLPK